MEYRSFFLPFLTIIAITAAAAQPHSNITLSSILTTTTAGARNLSLLSPFGEFDFGFLPLPTYSSLFLLSIWFANLPNTKTLIWTPNRGKPLPHIPPSSSPQMDRSPSKISLESNCGTTYGAPEASYAAMLDTGNFVLVASNSSVPGSSY